ncbi:MAG: GNAT family N-acetyltransferase [Actinocrinis sp.]
MGAFSVGPSAADITVRPAVRRDLVRLAAQLARASEQDPVVDWLLPRRTGRRERLRLLFRGTARSELLDLGGIDVACDGSRLAGGALWFPPGTWPPPIGRRLRSVPYQLRALGTHVLRGQRLAEAGARVHPPEPHWFLLTVGVDPLYQGLGIGAKLLRNRLDQADREREPVYLECGNPANLPLYEHFGFTLADPVPLPPGAPDVVGMWRPAA